MFLFPCSKEGDFDVPSVFVLPLFWFPYSFCFLVASRGSTTSWQLCIDMWLNIVLRSKANWCGNAFCFFSSEVKLQRTWDPENDTFDYFPVVVALGCLEHRNFPALWSPARRLHHQHLRETSCEGGAWLEAQGRVIISDGNRGYIPFDHR